MHSKFLIIGGGTGGICVAARLKKKFAAKDITIVEPAKTHAYQPMWTLVAAGLASKASTIKPMASVMPSGVNWIKEFASEFKPESNEVILKNGETIKYDYLIVAPGIQLDFKDVKGLPETLGKNGVGSNYYADGLDYVLSQIKSVESGNVVFTMPHMPIKCPGAPQKIMWLAHFEFLARGVRDKVNIHYVYPGPACFGIPRYREPLDKLIKERNIITHFGKEMVEVDSTAKKITIKDAESGATEQIEFNFLHAVPPQSAPDFIKKSPLANEAGWVDIDKHTMQHVKYSNVFALGDAGSSPNSKTGAAIRKQAPVLVENLMKQMQGQQLTAQYDGYASCPLVVSPHQVILAEFGYDGKIMESFPFDQSKPRYSMFFLKKIVLPILYWYFMLKGRA